MKNIIEWLTFKCQIFDTSKKFKCPFLYSIRMIKKCRRTYPNTCTQDEFVGLSKEFLEDVAAVSNMRASIKIF